MSRLTFEQGYVCAVAELVRTHNQPTIASDVLRALGKIDWSKIDDFDRKPLEDVGLLNNTNQDRKT